ncbi:MAG: hypothetical protein ISR58_15085 [Anaerolineales bacterium]|nr:hypothetical protein [Anaerolineales bacterium]
MNLSWPTARLRRERSLACISAMRSEACPAIEDRVEGACPELVEGNP